MTSKESLEKFKLLYENKCKSPNNIIGFDVCYITIKQDLDRLEKLEKAIDILKHHSSIEFLNCTTNYFPIAIKENKEEECDYTIINVESKENYDLLKEVFKNKED